MRSARLASTDHYGLRTPFILEFAASDHSYSMRPNEWASRAWGGKCHRHRVFAFPYLQAETLSLEINEESGAVFAHEVMTADRASAAHVGRV